MKNEIKHDVQLKKFYVIVEGKEAALKYRELENKVLEYFSTFVPSELRGHGIAAELTKFAFNYAREHHFTIRPSCSYVRAYLDRHANEYPGIEA